MPSGRGATWIAAIPPWSRGNPYGCQLLPTRKQPLAPRQQRQAHAGDHREGDPRAHVGDAQEAVADRLHDVEERIDVGELLPRGSQAGDGVEDAAEEGEGEDDDVVDEARMVEGLGIDADDRAEGSEADDQEEDGDHEQRRLLDWRAGDRDRERGEADADDQRAEGAADQVADVDLPVVDRRG